MSSMIKQSDLTIIIPHLGGTKESEYAFNECRTSLTETEPEIKVITVRNGEKCNIHRSEIKILQQGQCKAVNTAVATVSTPWVLVTNDDHIYPPGWFEWLQDEHYSCISPMLIEPKLGAPTFEVQNFGGAGGDFNKDKFIQFAKEHDRREPPGGIRKGFNLPFLIKRELWNLIGGYDINYDPWGSNGDSDLEYKIKLAGVQPCQNTNSIVYHFSQTSGTFQSENQKYWHENFAYFEQKWGFPRTDEGIWEASFSIPEPPVRKFTPWWEGFYG